MAVLDTTPLTTASWRVPSFRATFYLLAILSLIFEPAYAKPSLLPGQFIGTAASIEAEALVGPISVGLSNSAHANCPCDGTNGKKQISRVSSLSAGIGGSLATGTVTRAQHTDLRPQRPRETQQTSTVTKLNLLGGLITADAVKAVATANATPDILTTSTAGSNLVNLVIAGQKIAANVASNTVIALPGVGTVTVKFVATGTYGTESIGLEVEMLRVQVSETNNLGVPVGAVIVVGEAYAGYDRVQPAAVIAGYAATLTVSADAGQALQEPLRLVRSRM